MSKQVKTIPLKKIARYSKKRILCNLLNADTFIGTDNLQQNKTGKIKALYTPISGTVTKYDSGNILIANIRPYLKKIWYATNTGGSSADVLTLVVNNKEFDSKFVYYNLFKDDFFSHMMAGSKGTKMPRGDKDQVLFFPIPNVKLNDQQKIAHILSTLDSKIKLNNHINSELEKMAKTLYDYWFVQFDFPNKNGKPYKSSGGKMVFDEKLKREIPEVWEVKNLKNNSLTKLLKPKIDKFEDEKIYLATADVQNNDINFQAEKITYKNRASRANMQPIENSIWFAKMKNSKKVLILADYSTEFLENFILSTGFSGLKCKKNSLEYIWGFINNDRFEFIKDRLANGATQEAINNDTMVFINLLIPKDEILKKYHLETTSIYQKIYNNQIENQKLAELRDWLLPMLMNGQVEVK